MKLQFSYDISDETLNTDKYFEEEGSLPFNTESKKQMKVMMNEICDKLTITDEYLVKKLEQMLKYELPFFATNRRLVRNWMIENFIF